MSQQPGCTQWYISVSTFRSVRSTSHKVPPRPTKPYDYWCTLASSSLKPEKTKDKRMYKTTFEILQSCDLELVCQHKVSLGLVRPQLRRPRDWSLTPVIMEICIPKPVGKNLLGTAATATQTRNTDFYFKVQAATFENSWHRCLGTTFILKAWTLPVIDESLQKNQYFPCKLQVTMATCQRPKQS